MKSKKKVLSLEECTHPFTCIFLRTNGGPNNGFYVSVNSDSKTYPIGIPATLEEFHYPIVKESNKRNNYYNIKLHDYDPFTDPAYL